VLARLDVPVDYVAVENVFLAEPMRVPPASAARS
jgi:hypothetical protein